MKEGQVFYADYAKPEGFCNEAWKAIYQYVFALAYGAGNDVFYYGDWIRKPGVAICSCNDGLRPVIFKLEMTEDISEIDYTPVRWFRLMEMSEKLYINGIEFLHSQSFDPRAVYHTFPAIFKYHTTLQLFD